MRSPFIKNIEVLSKKEKTRFNRRAVTFICCLFIAAVCWLLMTLSKEYMIAVSYPVEYINSPSDKVIANNLPQKIDIEIKSKGLFLLSYKFQQAQTVKIDLSGCRPLLRKNYFFLLTNSQINKITEQFASRIKVQRIVPDTIFLNFNKRVSKRVRVKTNLTLEIDKEFQQSDTVKIDPEFIEISGAAEAVSKIDHVETVPAVIKNINKPQLVTLSILYTDALKDVHLNPSKVKALINVKKYTEANIELPVDAVNLPKGFSIRTFPDKVNVTYIVAFDNYEKINASQFRAVVNYKKAAPGSNKLKITLEKYPLDIHSIKLHPEKAEYIIKK